MSPILPFVSRVLGHWRLRLAVIVTSLLLLTIVTVFILPVRNVIFYGVTEYAWRDVSTSDLFRIHIFGKMSAPDGIFNTVSCVTLKLPRVCRSNISAIQTYPHLQNMSVVEDVLTRGHGRYLPSLNVTQKLDHLYLYAVMAEALESVGVQHFLVAGSLMGVHRHRGFIPWDDDLDVSVGRDTWGLVKQSLSCVEGFVLVKFSLMHWKFHYAGHDYPFVDIFFYDMDDGYVWSLTPYIRKTYIYPTEYVFPLTKATFEGLTVPVPKDGLQIVKRIYNYDTCVAYKGHVDTRNRTLSEAYPLSFTTTSVPCAKLSYIYPMYQLAES